MKLPRSNSFFYGLCFITVFFISSCTITKRNHNRGFFVQWKHPIETSNNLSLLKREPIPLDTPKIDELSPSFPIVKKECCDKKQQNRFQINQRCNSIYQKKEQPFNRSDFILIHNSMDDGLKLKKQLHTSEISSQNKIKQNGTKSTRSYLKAAMWNFLIFALIVTIMFVMSLFLPIYIMSISGLIIFLLFLISICFLVLGILSLIFAFMSA
jgi:hypothetical protein